MGIMWQSITFLVLKMQIEGKIKSTVLEKIADKVSVLKEKEKSTYYLLKKYLSEGEYDEIS